MHYLIIISHRFFCQTCPMRKLVAVLSLTLSVLLFSAGEGFALPSCPEDPNQAWHNCFGSYNFDNGDRYVGEWRDNKKHGQGTYTFGPSSEFAGDKYVGEFKDNYKDGHGTYTFDVGDKYVGGWRNGNFNGFGTYTYADGDKYVGEFKDNRYNGHGTYIYANGDQDVGEWRDGEAWNTTVYKPNGFKSGEYKNGVFTFQ